MRKCSVPNCDKPLRAKGLCGAHYQRRQKTGSERANEPIQAPFGTPLQWLKDHVSHIGDECLIWPFGRLTSGYPSVVKFEGTILAHRVMCILAHGQPPEGKPHTAHTCGKGHLACVNPNHVKWSSVKDNEADKKMHGTNPAGERNPFHKLTQSKVDDIRSKYATGRFTYLDLADLYQVNRSCIAKVVTFESWKS